MRMPGAILEHRIDVRPLLEVPQPTGGNWGAWVDGVHCLVIEEQKLVIDARISSETHGVEVLANTHILLQPEDAVNPGDQIRTPRGKVVQVITTAYLEHTIAPSQAQAWCA